MNLPSTKESVNIYIKNVLEMKAQVQQIQSRNKRTLNTGSKLAIGKTYQYILFSFNQIYIFSYKKCLFEMESY